MGQYKYKVKLSEVLPGKFHNEYFEIFSFQDDNWGFIKDIYDGIENDTDLIEPDRNYIAELISFDSKREYTDESKSYNKYTGWE